MALFVLGISVALNIGMYRHIKGLVATSDTVEVVRFDTVCDTMPVVRYETQTKVIRIPLNDTILRIDTVTNEAELPVVQRTYTDDSTYTAYVSGVRIDSFPRLDSIMVRQKTIERTITNTIYRNRRGLRLKVRPSIGGGYGLTTGKWDVWAGGSLIIDF